MVGIRRKSAKKTAKRAEKGGGKPLKNPKNVKFSRKKLMEEILTEGKVLGLHRGATEVIAEKTVNSVEKWAKRRTMVTQEDLDRAVAKEIKKYHADLAYVYQNRGKII